MPEMKRPSDYSQMARLRGAVWLGPVARNANTRTWWKCLACGRWWRTIYNVLHRGGGCPDCAVRRRNAINTLPPDAYHQLAVSRGFRWVGRYPGSVNVRTEWLCSRGHSWLSTYSRISEGRGCPECARAGHLERCARDRHTEDDYRAAGARAGLEWLGILPVSAHEKTRWRCIACGRTWDAAYQKLTHGRACPRCRLDRRNAKRRLPAERYSALAVERGFEWLGPEPRQIRQHTRWRCPKGHEWEASYNCVDRGSGCHDCQDRVNGALVSGVQRRLARLLGGELNHRLGLRTIDVAVEREGVRIAISYDGWYWHGCVQEQDAQRERELIRLGWRVLRIRSAYLLPSKAELESALDRLVCGEESVVITLKDWGVGPTRGQEWEPHRPRRPYRRKTDKRHPMYRSSTA